METKKPIIPAESGILLAQLAEIAKKIKEVRGFSDGVLVVQSDGIVYWQHRDGTIEI